MPKSEWLQMIAAVTVATVIGIGLYLLITLMEGI